MSADTDPAALLDARAAADRRDWPRAVELLRTADAEGALEPADLERLAKAAWWTGDPNASIEAHERAYLRYLEGGDRAKAAAVALTLRREQAAKLASSVAAGWLTRAERLLADEPETVAHGYLTIAHGELAQHRGELDHAIEHFDRALEIAERADDADLRAWAMMRRGMALVARGQLDEGWLVIEDVSAAATGGELGAYTTGAVFCNVIETCRNLADYQRAGEWSDAATRWCERQSISGFPGVCRVRRAEVLRLLGTWREAEAEADRASVELQDFSPMFAAVAFHELGEVRLRLGDLAGADAAFTQAHEIGHDPEPGRSLLLLRQGKAAAAAASIRRSLEETTWDRLGRARLLPAAAWIARATGDADGARDAADELAAIAEEYPTGAIVADADRARGISALLDGSVADAIRHLRSARRRWREGDAPYEAATTALLLAEAYLDEGDVDAATLELSTARSSLARLGARLDLDDAERLAARVGGDRGSRASRTFLFSDIVDSTVLISAIGDESWADLRRWHQQTLRACFERHGGEEVDEAGDGFFVAFEGPSAAVACAIEIQRVLRDHRRTHGFAPRVRIGVHAADAVRSHDGYSGRGVHEAARIGALAGGEEIFASAATVAGVPGLAVTAPRPVALKGLSEPMEIVTIDWRRDG